MNQEQSKNIKPYYNNKLANKLKRIIDRDTYGDFAIIIEDILQRRAYEFEFSDAEIIEQAINFAKNVKSIDFVQSTDNSIAGTAMGVYCPTENCIKINQDYFLNTLRSTKSTVDFGEHLYETLTHEIYHAIGDYLKEKGYLGLSYTEQGKRVGASLDEVFIETAADRATMSRTSQDAQNGRRDTFGYGTITFSTNLLAASLGITEKELLKAGLQNREQLLTLIRSKCPTPEHAEQMENICFKSFETTLDTLYNLDYKKQQDQFPQELEIKRSILKGALVGIYNSAYEMASYQIAVDGREVDKGLFGEVKHNFSKMEKIMNNSLNAFATRYSLPEQDIQEIYEGIKDIRLNMASKIVGMDFMLKQGHKITDPLEYELQMDNAKRGMLFKTNNILHLQERYGIEIPNNIGYKGALAIASDEQYESYILKEDFDEGMQWDNVPAAEVLKKMFVRAMEVKGIRLEENGLNEIDIEAGSITEHRQSTGFLSKMANQIKTFIARFRNRNQAQLPSAHTENSEYSANVPTSRYKETELDRKYRVNPKDMISLSDLSNSNQRKVKDDNVR